MKPLAIIGLDPGTTCAYAALGLDGILLSSFSAKELPLSEIIARVIAICQPVIVATDKAKVPSLIQEFSRKMGVRIIAPEQDLEREEKRLMLLAVGSSYHGDHEQDCLAAALYAHKKCKILLEKIHRFVEEQQLHHLRNEFTKIALQEDLSFLALKNILTAPAAKEKIMKEVITQQKITKRDFVRLYERFTSLQQESLVFEKKYHHLLRSLKTLQTENRFLNKKLQDSGSKISALFAFKEERLRTMHKEIDDRERQQRILEQRIEGLYLFLEKVSDHALIKKFPTLSKEDFWKRREKSTLAENEILFIENPAIYSEAVLQELQRKDVTIISHRKIPRPLGAMLSCAMIDEKPEMENEHFVLISPQKLSQALGKPDIEKVIREYQERR